MPQVDGETLDEWERWAFRPRFVGLALCGVGIVAAALLWKRPGWRALAMVFTLLTVLLAYDAHERRKLVPPLNSVIDCSADHDDACGHGNRTPGEKCQAYEREKSDKPLL